MAPTSTLRMAGWSAFYFLFTANYIATYHYSVHFISGPSMAPLLSPNYLSEAKKDMVLFKKNIRLTDAFADVGGSGDESELKRGMVVGFLSPTSGIMAVKRVVALAGDKVKPLGRHNLSEAAKEQDMVMSEQEQEVTVPFGHVWVEGDQVDREKNLDSNTYGPISKSLIKGVAVRILWPLERQGPLNWEQDWEKKARGRITRTKDDHYLPAEWMMY